MKLCNRHPKRSAVTQKRWAAGSDAPPRRGAGPVAGPRVPSRAPSTRPRLCSPRTRRGSPRDRALSRGRGLSHPARVFRAQLSNHGQGRKRTQTGRVGRDVLLLRGRHRAHRHGGRHPGALSIPRRAVQQRLARLALSYQGSPTRHNIFFPVMWLDRSSILDDDQAADLKTAFEDVPALAATLFTLFLVFGILCMAIGGVTCYLAKPDGGETKVTPA